MFEKAEEIIKIAIPSDVFDKLMQPSIFFTSNEKEPENGCQPLGG